MHRPKVVTREEWRARRLSRVVPKGGFGQGDCCQVSSGTAACRSWGVGEFLVPVSLVPLRPAKFVSFLLAVQPTHTAHHISASPQAALGPQTSGREQGRHKSACVTV